MAHTSPLFTRSISRPCISDHTFVFFLHKQHHDTCRQPVQVVDRHPKRWATLLFITTISTFLPLLPILPPPMEKWRSHLIVEQCSRDRMNSSSGRLFKIGNQDDLSQDVRGNIAKGINGVAEENLGYKTCTHRSIRRINGSIQLHCPKDVTLYPQKTIVGITNEEGVSPQHCLHTHSTGTSSDYTTRAATMTVLLAL